MSELTQTVMRFKRTGTGFDELEKRVCLLIYDFPKYSPGIDEDTRGEFLLYMLPRLRGIVDRYRPYEVAFEGYLFCCMRWKLKTFLRRRTRARLHSRIEWDRHVWEDVRRERLVERSPGDPDFLSSSPQHTALPANAVPGLQINAAGRVRDRLSLRAPGDAGASFAHETDPPGFPHLRKRNGGLLYFCLKAVCDIREEELPRVAVLCNVSTDWLAHCRYLLNIRCRERRQRLSALRYRQEGLYERLRAREELLLYEVDPEKKALIRLHIRKLKHSYIRCSHEADHVNLRPSNRDIAELLNIPKGSVDSGVTHARKVLSRFLGAGRS